MGGKSPYPEEFRKDVVALCRAAGGKRTYAAVAAGLGITAESLRTWVRKENESQVQPGRREAGVKVSDSDIDALPMHRHRFHGDWNYTLHPQPRDTTNAAKDPRSAGGPSLQLCTGSLRNPELTGMPEPALDELVDQLAQKLDKLRE
ncbi:hypothetical protein StrepF001_12520 [Streptomyces sp. F001]|nr:hypothetical protein StrepF001_12520 [Streptomyces sp. F001]